MKLPALLTALVLTACAAGPSKPAMDAAFATWKGHQASEARAAWGSPDTITEEDGLGVLEWKAEHTIQLPTIRTADVTRTGENTAVVREVSYGDQSFTTRCYRVLVVDRQAVIRGARWAGGGCTGDPEIYSAPTP